MAITKLQSPRDFFRIWFFWKRQAVFIFFIIIGLVMFYAYTVTPRYESTAEVLVLPKTNEGKVISTGVDDQKILSVTSEDIYTEMELIGSNYVLKTTVDFFGPDGLNLLKTEKSLFDKIVSSVKAVFQSILQILKLTHAPSSKLGGQIILLKNSLTIEPIIDSNLILISLRAEKSEKTTLVLNKLISIYMRYRDTVYTQEDGKQFYADQAKDYEIKLDQSERELKLFQKQWNIVNLQIQNQANIDLLTILLNELKLLEIEYEGGLSKILILKGNIKKDASILYLTKEMRDIPAIVELEKGIVPILIKRSEISKNFVKSSREYQSVNDQIAMLRGEVRHEIEKAIKTDELELESKKIQIEALKNKINFLKNEANEFSQREKKHKELERHVKLYRDSYLLYTTKTENAIIDSKKQERNLANVTIAAEPTIPERPAFPNKLLMLVLSIFFGSFAALCTPFIIESIDTKIKTVDDVEVMLKLPVISSYRDVN